MATTKAAIKIANKTIANRIKQALIKNIITGWITNRAGNMTVSINATAIIAKNITINFIIISFQQ